MPEKSATVLRTQPPAEYYLAALKNRTSCAHRCSGYRHHKALQNPFSHAGVSKNEVEEIVVVGPVECPGCRSKKAVISARALNNSHAWVAETL